MVLSLGLGCQWEGGGSLARWLGTGRVAGHGQGVRYRAGAQAEDGRTHWSHFLGHLAYSGSHKDGEKLRGGGEIGRTWGRATELPAREANSEHTTKQGHLSRKRRGNEDT